MGMAECGVAMRGGVGVWGLRNVGIVEGGICRIYGLHCVGVMDCCREREYGGCRVWGVVVYGAYGMRGSYFV